MTIAAVVVLVVLLPVLAYDVVQRPLVRRLGLRNLARRPGEAALVVVGAMLGTALIVASFTIGDSVEASFRQRIVTDFGPLDVLLTTDDAERDVAALRQAQSTAQTDTTKTTDGASIDALLAIRRADVVAANDSGKVEPNITLWEVDLQDLRQFEQDAGAEHLGSASNLPDHIDDDEAVINRRLADELRVDVGDQVGILVDQTDPKLLEVVAISPSISTTSFAPILVAPCALSCRAGSTADAFQDVVVVSNTGGVFEGSDRSAETQVFITENLDQTTPPFALKAVMIERADVMADEITTQFATVSGFSVAAGIVLLIKLFIMLAVERKSEVGTMRAVGVQVRDAGRAFALESSFYSIIAVVIGVLAGVGLASIVISASSQSFGAEHTKIGLVVKPSSVFSGAVIGLALSMVAGMATSHRVTRMSVVAALTGSGASSPSDNFERKGFVGGIALALVAVIALVLWPKTQAVVLVAPVVLILSPMPLVSRIFGRRWAIAMCCGLSLAWTAAILNIADETFASPAVEMLLVQGLVMVALGVALVTLTDRWLISSIRNLLRGWVTTRLGLSHPLAWPFRSAMLLGVYSLVLFTITFIAVINAVLGAQVPKLASYAGGSYEMIVHSSPLNPLTNEDLTNRPDVATAVTVEPGSLVVVQPREDSPGELPAEQRTIKRWSAAVGPSFAMNGPPVLIERSPSFTDDQAAWLALANGTDVVIAPVGYGFEVGETVPVLDVDGSPQSLRVIALSGYGELARTEFYLPEGQSARLLIDRAQFPTRHYVKALSGVDPKVLASNLEEDHAVSGVDARTFIGQLQEQSVERQAFVEMLQAFLALGMLVGIAGLGVVLVRGVRERRSQLGMLRAIGFSPTTLRNTFLVEAAFVGVRGTMLGIGLGLLMGWQVTTQSPAFRGELDFTVPYQTLLGLAAAALSASVMAGLIPAIKAGRTVPAEALRLKG